MRCLECDKTQFIEREVLCTPDIHGEIVEVIAPCMVCKNCQSRLMNTKQMDFLRRVAADKYNGKIGKI